MSLAEAEIDLRSHFPSELAVLCSRDFPCETERLKQFLKADIACGNIPVEWLPQATRLRWLQLESAGVEAYLDAARRPSVPPFPVTNMRGVFGVPVAETLVAGLLALHRGLPRLIRLQDRRQWLDRPSLRTIHGSQAVVLGAGSIGRHVRRLLAALGASVQSMARTAPDAEIHDLEHLDRELPKTDLIVGCLPSTAATRQLLDARRLGLCKAGAIVANGGRGSLIDETSLVNRLKTGQLGGAVLDVTNEEPLPVGHPLWDLPNVILTQHTAGGYPGETRAKTELFLANLERFRRGQTLLNQVDFSHDC